jgi:hypothetical protein
MSEIEVIDIRCPENPRLLFLKLRRAGVATPVVDGNLIELACELCKKTRRNQGEQDVLRVLHYYDLTGTCVESKVVRAAPEVVQEFRARGQRRANPS